MASFFDFGVILQFEMGNDNYYNKVLDNALSVLARGGTMLYPTDTIWGIGCDATNEDAVEKIYALKERDHSKSMLVLCSDLDMVERFVGRVGDSVQQLLMSGDRPTTVILPIGDCDRSLRLHNSLAGNLMAADGTIGVRIPRMDFCRRLLALFGNPVVSTSANFSGRPSPKCFGDIDPELIMGVDYCVPACFEQPSDGRGSKIVKINSDGKLITIRE